MKWSEVIKENRPNVSVSTVKTYASSINTFLKHVGISDSNKDYFNKHYSEVMKVLKNYPSNKRKNLLSAFIAVTSNEKALKEYRTQMLSDITEYNADQKKQTMTGKQKENWISQEEVMDIYEKIAKEVQPLWNKNDLKPVDIKKLMGFVALSCYVLIPPRRLIDYTLFKLRNVDNETDNYITGRKFVFNKYKTAKTYGRQEVTIPYKLHSIIQRWKNKHLNDYLLFNKNGTPMQPSKLTVLLNNIFDKKISASMLRHIFLSDKLKDVPALSDLEETAEEMGHSLASQQTYRKLK
jgi:hypothetical protein